MGIVGFNKILMDFNIKNFDLKELKTDYEGSYNLYIDGSFIMFSGCISENKNENGDYNESKIAETAFFLIQKNINNLKGEISLNKVFFYIDGIKPTLKYATSKKRRESIKNEFNIQEVLKSLIRLLIINLSEIKIIHLICGEAEHECFIRRDTKNRSLILTDDTDIFHIAYLHNQLSYNDVVYTINKSFTKIYNLSELNFKIPKLAFLILVMLKGSDFTNKVFTDSMCNAILSIWIDKKVNNIEIDKYKKIIHSICENYKNDEYNIQTLNKTTKSLYCTPEIRETYLKSMNDMFDKEKKHMLWLKLKQNDQKKIYNDEDIFKIIRYFIRMLVILKMNKRNIKFRWNILRNSPYFYNSINTKKYIDNIIWAVNYSLIGSLYDEYENNTIEYIDINSPYNFYIDILETESYNSIDDKKISRTIDKNYFDDRLHLIYN